MTDTPQTFFNSQHTFLRSDQTMVGKWWWTMDRWLLGTVFILITLGVLLSFGTSPAAAARLHYSDAFHFAIRQTLFGGLAVVLVIAVSMLQAKTIRRVAFFVYAAMIIIMAALPFIGHEAKGATRWVHFAGFTLQPSEFMKPALVVLVAWMFAEGQKGEGVPGVFIAFCLYGIAVVLLLIQPDVGQTVLITVAFGAAFWMAGVPISWIMGLGVTAMLGLGSTYFLLPHVHARVDIIMRRCSGGWMPIMWASEVSAPGPTPSIARPSLIWSTSTMRSATIRGWW